MWYLPTLPWGLQALLNVAGGVLSLCEGSCNPHTGGITGVTFDCCLPPGNFQVLRVKGQSLCSDFGMLGSTLAKAGDGGGKGATSGSQNAGRKSKQVLKMSSMVKRDCRAQGGAVGVRKSKMNEYKTRLKWNRCSAVEPV